MSVLIWGLIVFFAGLYLSLIFNRNVWEDEVFTIQLLDGNLTEITLGTAADVHPPLYYYWVKIFRCFFGDNIQAYKIASIIPMLALFVFGATKIRSLFGDAVSFFFILFLACVPCSMEFAVQIRMYTMAILFVTMCGVYAYEVATEPAKKSYILFIGSAVLAAYTHYFALVSVMVICGLLFIKLVITKRTDLKYWLISVVVMLLLYAPWGIALVRQITMVNEGYWIQPITGKTILGFFTWAFALEDIPGMTIVFLILLAAAGVFLLLQLKKKEQIETAYMGFACMAAPTLTVVGGVFVSMIRTPIYRDQYIFPSFGLLALAFALGIKRCKPVILAVITAVLLLVGACQYKENFMLEYRSTMVEYTYNYLEWKYSDEDYILYSWKYFDFMYEYYFKDYNLEYVKDFDFEKEYRNLWYLGSADNPFDTDILEKYNLEIEYQGTFGIEHGPFELYRIFKNTAE